MRLVTNHILPGLSTTGDSTFHEGDEIAIGSHRFGPSEEKAAHYHVKYDEFCVVVRGEIVLEIEDETLHLNAGDKALIARGSVHRVHNASNEDTEVAYLKVPYDENDTIFV